ncbi:MAG: hypothetical protein U1E14_08420 [Geminicoccaceae bacterium]
MTRPGGADGDAAAAAAPAARRVSRRRLAGAAVCSVAALPAAVLLPADAGDDAALRLLRSYLAARQAVGSGDPTAERRFLELAAALAAAASA